MVFAIVLRLSEFFSQSDDSLFGFFAAPLWRIPRRRTVRQRTKATDQFAPVFASAHTAARARGSLTGMKTRRWL